MWKKKIKIKKMVTISKREAKKKKERKKRVAEFMQFCLQGGWLTGVGGWVAEGIHKRRTKRKNIKNVFSSERHE